jgi:hypothetical protein
MVFAIVPRLAREDCRSGFAVTASSSEIVKKVVIFVVTPEASCGQRGTSIARRLSSVTELACLPIREAAGQRLPRDGSQMGCLTLPVVDVPLPY